MHLTLVYFQYYVINTEEITNLFIYHSVFVGQLKIYLFFDAVHLIKTIRNNLLNRTKYDFPESYFGLFEYGTDVLLGYISWRMFYNIHELDEKLQGNLRKVPKLTYKEEHTGNNKQDVSFASSIFDETASAGSKSYNSNRLDTASFLKLFHKVLLFVIQNNSFTLQVC